MSKKSPFPGMDPWLEQHWRDIHSSLVVYTRDALQEHLPEPLRARVEERVFVESPTEDPRAIYPDIRVVEHGRRGVPAEASPRPGVGTTTIAEPLMIHVPHEAVTQRFLEIVDAGSGNRVITAIEVLSRSNKVPGEGQNLYRRKQRELAEGKVSLVEIDLLRGGERALSIGPGRIPPSYRTPYQVVVRRGYSLDKVEVYRVPLCERLPVIGIPLRESDPDAPLDLQQLIELAYRNGRYETTLDYSTPPDPPLEAPDAEWASTVVRATQP
jgi:hypothetical protein